MTEKRWLSLILVLFVCLAVVYALITPAFEASDELWHYPMVRHLADGNPLPVQVFDPALAGPWKQEASQPPLYYYAGAALTFWIDSSDMATVRRENPHVDNGLITADGNTNLVVHDVNRNPWQGTLLALRIVRLMSVLMGAVTVYLTYRIAAAAIPGRPEIALGAAATTAFLPMFLFISGAVNNDNLAIMLASLALAIMIWIVAATDVETGATSSADSWRRWGRWLLLGTVIGLALLTKEGTLGLLPLAWGTGFVAVWLRVAGVPEPSPSAGKTFREFLAALAQSVGYFLLLMLPVVLIAGWWYWRNLQLYGDWLGWNAFIAVLGERGHPASLAQLWGERRGFMMAYWGLFGGVNIPMPGWVYAAFNALLIIAVPGFVFFAYKETLNWLSQSGYQWKRLANWIQNLMRYLVDHFALTLCLLFATAVVFGLVRWATTTWSSQGRLVFTALSALSTLFVAGLAAWMPQRPARWVMGLVAGLFLIVAAAAPFLWIAPAYDVAAYNLSAAAPYEEIGLTLGDRVRVHRAAIEPVIKDTQGMRPGDSFWVHLEWEPLVPLERDWSLFVHAVDTVLGQPIAQRDMYPSQGLQLSSWLPPGKPTTSSFLLTVPETAVAPAELDIVTGFYEVESGERLPTGFADNAILLGRLSLQPAPGAYPNPVAINFEDTFALEGYEIASRSVTPGDTLDLTLYWRSLQAPGDSYTFFAQVVDDDTTRWASIDYKPPRETQNWPRNEIMEMPLTLTISEDTPAGVYPLIVGIYTRDEAGTFDRLQIKTGDGRLTDDFVSLTPVRVEP